MIVLYVSVLKGVIIVWLCYYLCGRMVGKGKGNFLVKYVVVVFFYVDGILRDFMVIVVCWSVIGEIDLMVE